MNAREIRDISILTITDVSNCEILLEELEHAATQIEDDIARKFGDNEWERKARRALAEIEHKGKLARMKLESLSVGSYPEHVRYAILFHGTALRVLSDVEIHKIKDDPQMKTWRG